jgi:hypothetical protein
VGVGESTSPDIRRLDASGSREFAEESGTTALGPMVGQIKRAALRECECYIHAGCNRARDEEELCKI